MTLALATAQPGTDGPQSGPVVNPKPIDTQPGETT